jgi:hypothetical protein
MSRSSSGRVHSAEHSFHVIGVVPLCALVTDNIISTLFDKAFNSFGRLSDLAN